jgi:hypothetical protein
MTAHADRYDAHTEAADNSLAPCAACPRFVLAAELCECDDELGPMCTACHHEWHQDWDGSAA